MISRNALSVHSAPKAPIQSMCEEGGREGGRGGSEEVREGGRGGSEEVREGGRVSE